MSNYYKDTPGYLFHLRHPLMKTIARLCERDYTEKDQYDYAPVNFEDAVDSYDKVLNIVGDICTNTIAPNADSVDREGPRIENNEVVYATGTRENYNKLHESGLIGMTLPRKYAGLNFPIVPYVMAGEMIARADAGFANIWGLQDCAETIYEFGSEEQKEKYLPRFNQKGDTAAMVLTEPDAGSDLQAVQLKAHYDEENKIWRLNGVKRFITNGDADISLVLARSVEGTQDARGLSMFIYDRNSKAVEVRHLEKKLGIKGSPTTELVFKNAPAELVGRERFGLIKYVMSLMNSARLGVAAQSVGIAEAAYREALKYAHERKQFDNPIMQFPAVYEMLGNMKARIDALRNILYETARFVDVTKAYEDVFKERSPEKEERQEMKHYSKLANVFTPLIKLMSSEASNEIAYDALQIHGGTGFMKDFPIERIYRDARITSIYEGTSQLQVVAAIKGVLTGVFDEQIEEYDKQISGENDDMRDMLREMYEQYKQAKQQVEDAACDDWIDFHARRLVEMAGNILMGYILLRDGMQEASYLDSARIFIPNAASENTRKADYIKRTGCDDVKKYKEVTMR